MGAELSFSAAVDVLEGASEVWRLNACAEACLLDRGLDHGDVRVLRQWRDQSMVIASEGTDSIEGLLADRPWRFGACALAEDRVGLAVDVARSQ